MKPWQLDQIGLRPTTRTPEQLFQGLVAVARQLGFDFCAYGTRLPLPVTKPRIVTFNNYPLEWRRIYVERDYISIDPTVQLGCRSSTTMIWSDQLFASAPQLWKEAQSFGLRYGWCRSSFDSNGVGSLLTLVRSAEPMSDQELGDKSMMMD